MAPRKTSPEMPKRGRPRTTTPSSQPAQRAPSQSHGLETASSSKHVARGSTASDAASQRVPISSKKKHSKIKIYTDADLSASDDASSSGGDIPSRKEKQKADAKRKQEEAATADDDEEDEEEDEYVVEKVVGHVFDKKKLLFEVKWVDYPSSDNTMEPEANLEDNEKLKEYFKRTGGRPDPKTPARSDSTSKKRKLEETSTSKQRGAKRAKEETPSEPVKKGTAASGGRRKSTKADSQKEEPDWSPPSGSWEDSIINIDTMEIGDDGLLYAYVVWKDHKQSQHLSTVTNIKCPQKMLQFYEAHLQFKGNQQSSAAPSDPIATKAVAGDTISETGASKPSPQAANGATADAMETNGDDVESEEDMADVKGVATAV